LFAKTASRKANEYNIILITINVLRYDHLGCYDYKRKTSPSIDKLAKDSLVFKSAFTQAGYTLPNMMSIITSLFPDSHGVMDVYKDILSSKILTLAEILNIHGYKTAWFAVLDEPHLSLNAGFGRGYSSKIYLDEQLNQAPLLTSWIDKHYKSKFFITVNARHTHIPYFPLPKYIDSFRGGKKGKIFSNEEELSKSVYFEVINQLDIPGSPFYDLFDEGTKSEIKMKRDAPILDDIPKKNVWYHKLEEIRNYTPTKYMYLLDRLDTSTYISSIDIKDKDNLKYLISLYDACILAVDQELIKPVLRVLKKHNIYDNTLIIFTADHGESLGEHNFIGHGYKFYEQLIHVPLIIKLPHSNGKREIDILAQSVDILPTILDYLDIELPHYTQGKSLVPAFKENSTAHVNDFVFGQIRNRAYIRSKEWKLIVRRNDSMQPVRSDGNMLFNMRMDPQEQTNLISNRDDIYQVYFKKLEGHLNTIPKHIEKSYKFPKHFDKATREKIKNTGYW
jgi:arylsulfatase